MRFKIILLALIAAYFCSCKKFVEIPLPDNQLTADFVFDNDNTAVQAITGIYSNMMQNSQQFSSGYTTFLTGMAADELFYYTPGDRDEFLDNQISAINHPNIEASFWNPCYQYIYAANKCIEGASRSNQLSSGVKNTVIGEAKFIRAFCYFYLTNLFGDVPLILSTDYLSSESLPRTTQENIFTQIINDLTDAKQKLINDYPSIERSRPNRITVSALLTRLYLYTKNWASAEAEASEIINSGIYSISSDLNNVFQIDSDETIWQLHPVNPSRNTWEGNAIIPSSDAATPTYLLTNSLMNSFEPGDLRKINWTKSRVFSGKTLFYPFKYKVRTGSALQEYYVVFRLAEIYLTRSEARVANSAGLNPIQDKEAIVERTNEVKDLNLISELFALNSIRQLDAHKSGDFKSKFHVALKVLAIEPNSLSNNYADACDQVYDKVDSMFIEINSFLVDLLDSIST